MIKIEGLSEYPAVPHFAFVFAVHLEVHIVRHVCDLLPAHNCFH